jgi:triosephosphate isomerase
MRKRLLIANWKLNGDRLFIENYIREFDQFFLKSSDYLNIQFTDYLKQIIICPPAVYLDFFLQKTQKYTLGAQNCASANLGAYTGEISAKMLAESGCQYVLVGHSERRTHFFESNSEILKKIKLIQQAELIPVLCIGETLIDKQAHQTQAVLESQLSILSDPELKSSLNKPNSLVIAYEPVWAIGTGVVPELSELESIFLELRTTLKIRYNLSDITLLYGGSLTTQNAQAIFKISALDGGLVGGASLKPKDFAFLAHQLFMGGI